MPFSLLALAHRHSFFFSLCLSRDFPISQYTALSSGASNEKEHRFDHFLNTCVNLILPLFLFIECGHSDVSCDTRSFHYLTSSRLLRVSRGWSRRSEQHTSIRLAFLVSALNAVNCKPFFSSNANYLNNVYLVTPKVETLNNPISQFRSLTFLSLVHICLSRFHWSHIRCVDDDYQTDHETWRHCQRVTSVEGGFSFRLAITLNKHLASDVISVISSLFLLYLCRKFNMLSPSLARLRLR